jgi:RND family efflux transporter MFP subunit
LITHLLLVLLLQATPVGTVPLGEVGFAPSHDAPASVVARNESRLSAEISAVVAAIHVDVGSTPAAGDRLVTLDCRSYRLSQARATADLAALRSELDLAERQLRRAQDLHRTETISEELLDTRSGDVSRLSARLLGAQAALDEAELDVSRCQVRAPFAGVITHRDAQLGELTSPGAPLLTLIETDGAQIAASVSLDLAPTLEDARELRFAWQTGEVPVRVIHFLPVVDPDSRSRELRLEALGPSALSGTSGRLTWNSPGLAVQAHLLVRREGTLGLFVLDGSGREGRARFHALPEAVEGRPAFVDLPAGTRVITEGRLRLRDQDLVSLR